MKVKAHLHLPKRKRGDKACISVAPFAHIKGQGTTYAGTIILKNVRFKVSEPGRIRTVTNKVKNVHAWVVGDLVYQEADQLWLEPSLMNRCREASYNPYKNETFVDKESGFPLHSAQTAYMVGHKVYYVPEGQ